MAAILFRGRWVKSGTVDTHAMESHNNTGGGSHSDNFPDSKVHGANKGPSRGRQGPDGPHVGPMNFAILVVKTLSREPC